MTEPIQRAALAICINNGEDPDTADTPYEIRGWRLYKSDATACIETLLDPSEEAVEAMCRALAIEDRLDPDEDPNYVSDHIRTDMAHRPGARLWNRYERKARACIRAYHMSILGRDK